MTVGEKGSGEIRTLLVVEVFMGVKPDHWISQMARDYKMIEPFHESQVREGKISFGLSSYGYDFRVGQDYKVFQGESVTSLDPKEVSDELFGDFRGDYCVINPGAKDLRSLKIKNNYEFQGVLIIPRPLDGSLC